MENKGQSDGRNILKNSHYSIANKMNFKIDNLEIGYKVFSCCSVEIGITAAL